MLGVCLVGIFEYYVCEMMNLSKINTLQDNWNFGLMDMHNEQMTAVFTINSMYVMNHNI